MSEIESKINVFRFEFIKKLNECSKKPFGWKGIGLYKNALKSS